MNHRFLFLDSNILLHYTFFTDIDWAKVANTRSVELVLPYTVIKGLDEKKWHAANSAVKDRAKAVIARLERIASQENNSQVRENATLCLLHQEPAMDYIKQGLNRESEDDRILAEIFYYRQTHLDRDIAVVTGDFGFKLKCRQHDIPLVQLPAEYELPQRSDAQTNRIKELEAKLLELRTMQPKLRLAFPSGKDFTELLMTPPQILSTYDIEQQVDKKRQVLARKLADQTVTRMLPAYSTLPIEKAAGEEYLKDFKAYLHNVNEYAVYRSKVIELRFVLWNEGSASAEDTDVYIHVDSKLFIVTDDYLKKPPREPKLPDQRRRDSLRDSLLPSIIPLAERLKVPNISGPTIKLTPKG